MGSLENDLDNFVQDGEKPNARMEHRPFEGHRPIPPKSRIEFIDYDGHSHDTIHAAMKASVKSVLSTWIVHFLGTSVKVNTSADALNSILAGRDELLKILIPLRDAQADRSAAASFADNHGKVKDKPPKLARSERPVGRYEERDEDEDEDEDEDLPEKEYTRDDIERAFARGIEVGATIPPLPFPVK